MNKIEEIAKAAYDRRFGHTKHKWTDLPKAEKDPYLLDAVAFLGVISRPNAAMLRAGSDAMKDRNWPLPAGYVGEIWLAMVDAALD